MLINLVAVTTVVSADGINVKDIQGFEEPDTGGMMWDEVSLAFQEGEDDSDDAVLLMGEAEGTDDDDGTRRLTDRLTAESVDELVPADDSRRRLDCSDGKCCPSGYTWVKENLDGHGKKFTKPGKGIENCKAECERRDGCTSFEYNHGGNEGYKCGTYTGSRQNGSNLRKPRTKLQASRWNSCIRNTVCRHKLHNEDDRCYCDAAGENVSGNPSRPSWALANNFKGSDKACGNICQKSTQCRKANCMTIFNDNSDYWYSKEIKTLRNVKTAEDCAWHCLATRGCAFWTLGKQNTIVAGNCYLKATKGIKVTNHNTVSGSPCLKPVTGMFYIRGCENVYPSQCRLLRPNNGQYKRNYCNLMDLPRDFPQRIKARYVFPLASEMWRFQVQGDDSSNGNRKCSLATCHNGVGDIGYWRVKDVEVEDCLARALF